MGTPSPDLQLLLNLLVLMPFFIGLRWVVRSAAGVRLLMTVTGAVLVLFIAPRFLLFYLMYWVVIFAVQFMVHAGDKRRFSSLWTLIAVLTALSPLVIWKLAPAESVDWFSKTFNTMIWEIMPILGPVDSLFQFLEPIGMSFTIFRAIDLIVKVRIGLLAPLSLGRVYYYGFFPAILTVGPISEYEEVRIENRLSTPQAGDMVVGMMRLCLAGLKLFILAPILAPSLVILSDFDSLPVMKLWLGLVAYSWWFYINFSGFSDLSIGAARIMGFKLKENFNNPYFKSSPQKFWANWHMSLTRFAQRNVYILVGGFRNKTQYIAIFATMMVIALWHSPNLALVAFGCYHSALLIMERGLEMRSRKIKRKPSKSLPVIALKTLATFFLIIVSIPLLVVEHGNIPSFYSALFGL